MKAIPARERWDRPRSMYSLKDKKARYGPWGPPALGVDEAVGKEQQGEVWINQGSRLSGEVGAAAECGYKVPESGRSARTGTCLVPNPYSANRS